MNAPLSSAVTVTVCVNSAPSVIVSEKLEIVAPLAFAVSVAVMLVAVLDVEIATSEGAIAGTLYVPVTSPE